ncbi:MAG: cellulase family glycosylhydrolase [Lachnospiraceae bacterium]|nr:cellulase family glycosylhydrolase [Lachnospiraceae bacterium]
MDKKISWMRCLKLIMIILLAGALVGGSGVFSYAGEAETTEEEIFPRPSENGRLSVKGTKLVDESGEEVILKGVSLHGITWYPDFINANCFRQVSQEWEANLIRVPVYSEEYVKKREECLTLARKAIDTAIAEDMYVLLDWHILEDKDPNIHIEEAKDMFDTLCAEYADVPNVIYEICNEPNGETTWSDIRDYAYQVIPLIRGYSPDSVIVVGTPDYSKNLTTAARNILEFDNIMYALHFYAGTHREDLRRELITANSQGLPVFVTECGLSEASGDGEADFDSAASWFSLMDDFKISYTVWSFSNKNETSALLLPKYDPVNPITDQDLTRTGLWVRSLLQGEDPRSIQVAPETTGRSKLPAWLVNPFETENLNVAKAWPVMALGVLIFLLICSAVVEYLTLKRKKGVHTYDDLFGKESGLTKKEILQQLLYRGVIILSLFFSLLYITWRIRFSIPFGSGALAIGGNILLLIVEVLGLIESVILYRNLMKMRRHPLPEIADDEFPDVDIFIATYNEPADLLSKTVNGCLHLKYPDKSKVHIWLCDDNRRAEIRKLAENMGVGYFDRPDNKGAKAGNLNHALGLTSAPYVITLDADMIPRSNFLLATIPYFVNAKKLSEERPEDDRIRLGLLQTPQSFYTPDVFQHALYAETNTPNEQDFFYRTIEVAKTGSNSVIYGGSNTVISREALDAIGGFYTESITEDFATGLLIESAGFVSLALPEPLASGMTPYTYKEHIQQRKRWGRGVIATARQLHLLTRPGLTFSQRASYWSSVIYWYSPIKNMIYLISPLLFATFAIPVFKCGWLDLMMYWFPMFIMQDICLRVFSGNAVSLKWSGIYETSVMPHLFMPVIKEALGISAKVFEVTDKGKSDKRHGADIRSMIPFLVLIALSVIGIIRSIYVFTVIKALGVAVLLFWLIRNTYFLLMSVFLIDGRDSDKEDVLVKDAEFVKVKKASDDGTDIVDEGVTTLMTEHSIKVYLDENRDLNIGDRVDITITRDGDPVTFGGVVTGITYSRYGGACVYSIEITDFRDAFMEYQQILYDRVPTLPQTLANDNGIIVHMMKNIAYRILR